MTGLPTFVYIIKCETTSYYKIGIATDVKSRLQGIQTGNPYKLTIIYSKPFDSRKLALETERLVHIMLCDAMQQSPAENEWFQIPGISTGNPQRYYGVVNLNTVEQFIESKWKEARHQDYIKEPEWTLQSKGV